MCAGNYEIDPQIMCGAWQLGDSGPRGQEASPRGSSSHLPQPS